MKLLFVYEHNDRESFLAKRVCGYYEKHGHNCSVSSLAYDFVEKFLLFRPDCVFLPFLPKKDSPLGRVVAASSCVFIIMNWEQYLSESGIRYRGNIIKEYRSHALLFFSWSEAFTSFLISSGIAKDRILRAEDFNITYLKSVGKPMWPSEYSNSYDKFIFLPMNYSWAFASEKFIHERISNGYDPLVARRYVEYANICLSMFVDNIYECALDNPNWLFLIRPHPSVPCERYSELFDHIPSNIVISKEGQPRDFLLACDLLISSWSTLALHKALLSQRSVLFTPISRPSFLNLDWNDRIKNITSLREVGFESAETDADTNGFYKDDIEMALDFIQKTYKRRSFFCSPYLLRLLPYNLKNKLAFWLGKIGVVRKSGIYIDHPSKFLSN